MEIEVGKPISMRFRGTFQAISSMSRRTGEDETGKLAGA